MDQRERLAVKRSEAAEMIGVSLRTFDTMLARKEIKGTRIGRRRVFRIEELQRFLMKDHFTLPEKDRSTKDDK